MDSNGKCNFLHSGECTSFLKCCPFSYSSPSTRNTALVVCFDQVPCKDKQKPRTCFFLFWEEWQSMAAPAHLGKSGSSTHVLSCCSREWGWQGEVWTARKHVFSRMCFFLGAGKHCRSFLFSGHDFSLPSYSLIFLVLFLWEGWPFSFVSGPSFPSFWQMHLAILSHLWLTLVYSSLPFHSHSSLAGSLPAHGTPSSVPFTSCAKSANVHF